MVGSLIIEGFVGAAVTLAFARCGPYVSSDTATPSTTAELPSRKANPAEKAIGRRPIEELRKLAGSVDVDREGNVVSVNLTGPHQTDAGLEHLIGLSQLETLYLWNTQITDAGLEHLNGLSQLQTLHLGGTEVTDAGVAELKKALPKTQISR